MFRAAVVLSVIFLSACAPPAQQPPAPRIVHFMAGYKPQANLPFVAVYVAQANGYFAQQGLQVDIAHASGQGEHLKLARRVGDRKSTRLNSSHPSISYAVFCLKKKK